MSRPSGEAPPAGPSDPASPEEGETGAPGLSTRLVQVLASPGALFEALEDDPVWVDALLVVTALSLATTLLIPQELVQQTMMQTAPEGVGAASVEEAAGYVRTAGIVAAVVGPVFVTALIAAATYLIFSLVLGGHCTYRKLFSAAAHVMVIPSLGALATVPLILATGDVQTSLALHLLVPGLGAEGYLFRFLRGINVFGLAGAGVMGVAAGTLYPGQSTRRAVVVLLSLYVAMKAVLAVAGGA